MVKFYMKTCFIRDKQTKPMFPRIFIRHTRNYVTIREATPRWIVYMQMA